MDADTGPAAAYPPPPPPPPAPSRPGVPWWASAAGLAVVAAVVAIVLMMQGGDGPATTLAGSTSTTTTATETTTSTTTAATTTTIGPTTTATTPTTTSTSTTTTTVVADDHYGPAALDYFRQIAGTAEYGGEAGTLHRWTGDLRIAVYGDPTTRDRRALAAVVDDLNEIIGTVEVSVVESDSNIEIYFVPVEEFAAIEPGYVEGNLGYVYIWWDAAGSIYSGRVLISTTGVTPAERAHLIREELTQGLGLLNDSLSYPESIFYQEWTETNRYTRLDRLVIEMLYRPELSVGMDIDEALTVLTGLEAG